MIEIAESSGNVYADFGRCDADQMLVKARLAVEISELIKRKALTNNWAAKWLGLSQPELTEMLRGQFRDVSEEKMMLCLNRLTLSQSPA